MPQNLELLQDYLQKFPEKVSPVVDFDATGDKLLPFDFTDKNREISEDIFADTVRFTAWVDQQLAATNSRYGIGGYAEHRTIYSRSDHFNMGDEPRRLHLGVDIWGAAGTPVYSPLDATVHSFRVNDQFGDYGPTVILKHDLDGLVIHSLYGHLSLESLDGLIPGKMLEAGQHFASFGDPGVNGQWPPHLHFQLIWDMKGCDGDYPGVCRFSERERWLDNCPDPELILKYTFKK